MKLNVSIFFLAACCLCSCQWGKPGKKQPDIVKDTLKYTYQTIKERADDCGNKADSDCTVAKIRYPIFLNQPLFNDTVIHNILTLFRFDEKKPDTNLLQLTGHFMSLYKEDKKTNDRQGFTYELSLNTALRQDSSLAALQLIAESYLGGAHGSHFVQYVNWDTKAQKKINLDDLLTTPYKEKLTAIAEKIFRRQENLSDTASYKDNYFFKDDRFSLNDNFLITPLGLRFIYNEYEIKPYAAGQTELLIPYSQIKSLLRPNTVLIQYLK